MMEMMVVIVVGLIGGVAVGTQGPIAGAMAQRVGGAASSLIVHVGGAIASLMLLATRGGEQLSEWRNLPWYMLGCGAFGLVLYLSLSHTVPRLGAAPAITVLIVGQLFAGMVIDHLGAFDLPVRSLDASRGVAALLLLAGAFIMLR